MNANDVRAKFLARMEKSGHQVIAPAVLRLENDPTTLFTGSGMQPLMPYLLGQKHPDGTRLTDSQPCFRSQDIEDVGDNRHTTFFEMLGNWSLGDYFKEFQIRQFFAFLTEDIGLDPSRIYVTCFVGDGAHNIPRDNEAAEIWQKVFKEAGVSAEIAEIGSAEDGDKRGIKPGERIFFYNDKENWWSRAGGIASTPIGDPCGPDSEVFYDYGAEFHDPKFGEPHPASDSGRFVEIGNQVFMQYRRLPDGSFEELQQKNVDFGGGLERLAAAAIDSSDIFKISILQPIISRLEELSHQDYSDHKPEMQIIADHLRASVFLVAQGLTPSNKEHGYVLRRLCRRAILKAQKLGLRDNFFAELVPIVAAIYQSAYPEISQNQAEIIAILSREESQFNKTLTRGLREFEKVATGVLTGAQIFTLHDTYGFPRELSLEVAAERGIKLTENWQEEFDAKVAEQKMRSQTATKGMFKGGLADSSDLTVKYHTAAHLLGAALNQVLKTDAAQKGANITAERLRFDFAANEKLTPEQITEVENLVNGWLEADLPVTHAEYATDYAFDTLHAHGVFRDKYGDKVLVYTIGGDTSQDPVVNTDAKPIISREICGGPHVNHTGEILESGHFKITKEESSSAGVRRIKAVLAK
ncbi:MAG: alanine--tRNA ligase [Candidatus Nomurabacteria bacterium]|jgi:alanyl-tRNA synthetase|nr:alanine--tRNA ligase [Candidatus Nomurabacteria bacterium]